MDKKQLAIEKHKEWKGKIEVISRAKVTTPEELSIAYTPGVAEPCLLIAEDEDKAYDYTRKGNLVAVITDGTAVLGLGDIGPSAGMPVMEGKCALFKTFADVDAFPLCVDSKDVDTIVNTIALISKSFGGINLEDIAAPRCFEIEKKLKERCDIPVFHDDQHGIVFAMANPVPEIMPDEAKAGGAAVVGTGRSDYPNQINNVLVFPGLFKGVLAVRAKDITEKMKIAAAHAIASVIPEEELNAEYVIPSSFDKRVALAVANAVAKAAVEEGINRVPYEEIK
ncbi:malic enzyme-like NAD(P)-binding protein [Clostridium sp. AM33-3]|uniref:NAD(P)-dependent malic enzyme n=1 Tax=Clostridium sp. AM33-3 TaxID=2292304 RepID=UPI000E4933BE|nr:malic enzyme-like NAD(P)-binding protein [Clostridium sp. AM33-3]RHT24174.1 NADP-dependent malic enzyme [Clostridium sp. AM33-3]